MHSAERSKRNKEALLVCHNAFMLLDEYDVVQVVMTLVNRRGNPCHRLFINDVFFALRYKILRSTCQMGSYSTITIYREASYWPRTILCIMTVNQFNPSDKLICLVIHVMCSMNHENLMTIHFSATAAVSSIFLLSLLH